MDRFGRKPDHYPRGQSPLSPVKSLKIILALVLALFYALLVPGPRSGRR